MPDITLIEADGREHAFEAPDGVSLMHAAVGWGVDGLVGECGGGLRCATCHVVVDPAWQERVGPPTAGEAAMLAFTACPAEPGSRLACQVRLGPALQGLVVRLPASQY
ncbi:2Fe-2S iron-sulfur cluster-binding protein [Piscinibacter sakaiensis]|uniref:Ferredoxin, 2Fe-2S n=1 Tax=Piscinibacter sakaiensis TaxID=1547922 RepID=A0A0K8P0N7_PISS1|nr:2Fe-2S iron-sulfur cluster-binding protein [Piscinibacter sakaiensis]GAP36217.1 ferredoxin, 2Fe-2S [Piscinibacter sakaiensis]